MKTIMLPPATQGASAVHSAGQTEDTATPGFNTPLLIPAREYRRLNSKTKEPPAKFPSSCLEPKVLATEDQLKETVRLWNQQVQYPHSDPDAQVRLLHESARTWYLNQNHAMIVLIYIAQGIPYAPSSSKSALVDALVARGALCLSYPSLSIPSIQL